MGKRGYATGHGDTVEDLLNEIDGHAKATLRVENERLKAALKPFARHYDLNDCKDRDPRGALEIPISDIRNAKRAYEQTAP